MQFQAAAMLAAFENDADGAIAAARSGVEHGIRERLFFADPIFDDLQADPRFDGVREQLDAILELERGKVLQLFCLENPYPQLWQPLPKTCEGMTGAR